ncbi:MAG: ZIP family metal transporter, partial [Saprospiraceae bacterium]
MSIWQNLLFIGTVIIGAFLALRIQINNRTVLKAMLSFSGAYLLSITFLHLLPSVYETGGFQVGFFILGGFILQLLLELVSKGVEHGHIHAHRHARPAFVWQVLLGLCLHSFLEGMPLGTGHYHGAADSNQMNLFYGIIAHKIPEALALVLLLRASDVKASLIYLMVFVLAIMTPAGALLAEFIEPSPLVASYI